MYKRKDFFKLLFSDSEEVSIKRFATFLAVVHFFTFSFLATFMRKDFMNKDLLFKILEIDFSIIGIGLGVITVSNIAQILNSRYINKTITSVKPDSIIEPGPQDNPPTQ